MATRTYDALMRSDSEIIKAAKSIDAEVGLSGNSTLNVTVVSGLPAASSSIAELDTHPVLSVVAGSSSATTESMMQQFAPAPFHGSWWQVHRKSGTDSIRIEIPNNVEIATAMKLIAAVTKHLSGFESTAGFERVLGPELQEFYRRREASVMRLEDLTQKLIDQNEQYRRTLDDQLAGDRQKDEVAKAEYFEKTQKEFEEKEAQVAKHGDELKAREKELDDRASRHVRRQIRKDFLEKLAGREKQFKLSESTNEKRRPIHVQFWLLLLISALIGASGLWSVVGSPNDVYAYVRLFLGAVGVAASTVYYIRWSDSWFRQHADEEFRLQRLALDFDRASWVVEMALEWQQEKEGEFPKELVERLTANLFVGGAASEASKHPVEELAAALFGASSNLKLPLPGGGELNVDRKGMKSLS